MKLFSTLLRRKRGIILFVAAFLFPLIFVVVAGIDTFSKRQKTTRNLLESNLWLSGRSALDKLELQFAELESDWLNDDYFNKLLTEDNLFAGANTWAEFMVGSDFKIVYPESISDKNNLLTAGKDWNSEFRKYMALAEKAEFVQQNYPRALNYYKSSHSLAKSAQQEASAIEGMARSYLADKDYRNALEYYQLLRKKYSITENRSGHPYGITAPLQLNAIGEVIGDAVFSRDSILLSYQMLNDRHWLISSSSYFFFKAEYESILILDNGPEESRFEKMLKFSQFLTDYVAPAIKERSVFIDFNSTNQPKRIYIQDENAAYIVSFKEMPADESEAYYFAGVCRNIDTILVRIITPILTNLEHETGLEFRLVNSDNIDLLSGKKDPNAKESLALPFNNIPVPWTLVAIQPGYKKLETDAKTQVIIYGLLVVIIIILMLFAVFILLRDISRETDSMLLQTEFVHNVSHELKTPLSLIRLYGETLLLKENLSEENRKEGLQIITKESERLSYMINNILDFSKIEMGRKEFDLKPGNLCEVVINTLDSYRYHFLKKGFSVEEEIDSDIPVVLFDKNAVEGILINLFSNAIKFSYDKKEMKVRLKQTPETIILEVIDKGIGIPQKELPNIFNRFYRVKSSTEFEARGSGLGLTLVKHAIDSHGWLIKVKSTPGEGSAFSILIPIKTIMEE